MSLDIISAASNPSVSVIDRDQATGASDADEAQRKLADDFDEFMLLFTTQLQNQDPTEPLDTNQMTEQLVQFTGVEQAVETNSLLEELIAQNSTTQSDSAVAYIGRFVETQGNEGILANGEARFSYDLPAGTQSALLTVMDQAGRPVHTQQIEGTPGSFTYNWDGVNSFDSTTMNDGIYQFGIAARDATGDLLDATTYTSGVVTSVSLADGNPVMTLNGQIEVGSNKIQSVVGIFE